MARKAKKKVEQPAWHVDFRNAGALPDIKPIRTDFLLNFVALAAMVGLLFYVAYTEYHAMQLRGGINRLEKRIQAATHENNQNLRLSAEFERMTGLVKEADEFTAMPVLPTGLLAALVDSLPPDMLLGSVAVTDRTIQEGRRTRHAKAITMAGSVSGADPLRSTQIVNDYVATIGALPVLTPSLERIALQSLQRDERLGQFTFNILVELKPR